MDAIHLPCRLMPICVLVFCLLVDICRPADSGEVVWEARIIRNLTADYVQEARPSTGPNQTVSVTVHPMFLRIDDLNERQNTFTASIIMIQSWTDIRLRWNPDDFGGVKHVRLPAKKLWLPDVIPYNTATMNIPDPLYEDTISVNNKGRTEWGPLISVTAKCPMDVTNFPFDTQTCNILFGSWLHGTQEMALQFFNSEQKSKDLVITDEGLNLPFVQHPYWDIVDDKVRAQLSVIKYGNLEFDVLSLTTSLRRKASFFRYLAIGPGALIGFLVPMLFLLPARSKEKNTFGMMMMLGLILLITVLADAIPLNHGSTPRVGLFYLITLMLITFSLLLSIMVSNLNFKGPRRRAIPQWVHQAFLSRNGLRRILCIDKYTPVDNLFSESLRGVEDHSESAHQPEPETAGRELENVGKLESQVRDVCRYLKYICGKLSADDSYRNVNQDWEELARVIDRVLFVIFFVIYALTAVALLT